MRYINIFILAIVFFTGCSVKQDDVIEVDVRKQKVVNDKVVPKQRAKTVKGIQEQQRKEAESFTQTKEDMKPFLEEIGFNIAAIFPSQVVGKYAIDGVNSINAYLLHKDVIFNLITHDCITEEDNAIKSVSDNIDFDKYRYVVLFMTKDGLKKFLTLEKSKNLKIYAPLINKEDIDFEAPNVVFGGIDYTQQFKELLKLANLDNMSEFHDGVSLGQTLSYKLDKIYSIDYKFQKRLIRNNINYESFLKTNKTILNTDIFLNTPIVQSSILLSQMRAYEVEYEKVLSTQINYTPLILSLTQVDDRKNMIIANSIGKLDDKLIESGAVLNTDFKYNWVNYSTLIGIDYLISQRFKIDRNFENEIIDNQVKFNVSLYETGMFSFKPYIVKNEEVLNPISK